MATAYLVLIGYAIAALAFLLVFARRRHRRQAVRWDLVLLATISGIAATVLARPSQVDPALAVLLRHPPLLVGHLVLLGTSVWLVVSVIAGLFSRRTLRKRPDVDFSFLAAESCRQSDRQSATPPRRIKINHRRWVERLNRLKVMHRWSFLSDPPS